MRELLDMLRRFDQSQTPGTSSYTKTYVSQDNRLLQVQKNGGKKAAPANIRTNSKIIF